jgi:hypothetical protein
MAGKQIVIVGEIYEQAGGQPPGIWGGTPPNYVDIGGPGSQPHPSHPIAPGARPPGFWGGVPPNYPDQGLPGQPPGFWGGRPPNYPDQGLPGQPPGFWGGRPPNYPDQGLPGPGGHPEHPIPPTIWIGPVLPPGAETPPPEQIEWHSAWSAENGWQTVGIPTGEAPTPSS